MSVDPDPKLVARLERHGQSHLLKWWNDLNETERNRLSREIAAIDFEQLGRLTVELVHQPAAVPVESESVRPIEAIRLPQTDGERVARRRAIEVGVEALAAGEVGVILVAGGAGTRLGYDGPKGTFPIGPVSS